jgi:pimeloyl-ACP methyl ester carboxylesterase
MNRLIGRVAPSWSFRVGALVLLAWLGSSGVAAWQLVARPSPPFAEPLPGGLVAEAVRLATRDGEELGGWYHAGDPGRAVVVLLHGLGGSRSTLGPAARRLAEAGQGFLALSLRSFGDSSGGELDFGWSSRADVLAAVEHVERLKPGAPIVVVGQSLGAAAAIFAAPELGRRVSGYILEAPYHDLDKACRDRLNERLLPPFSWAAYAGLRLWASVFLPTELVRLRPIEHVERFPLDVPVLFVAGTEDREAPVADVVELCGHCRGKSEIAILDGRDHQGLWSIDDRHWELWQGFLAAVEHPGEHLDPR